MKTALILSAALAAISVRAETVTFSEHISPIVYNNCTTCHRDGQIGPFPLTSYEEVAAFAPTIQYATGLGYMPPWPPDQSFSRFVGERCLTDTEIQLIASWVEAGSPQGDLDLEAPLPDFATGSLLGEPDLVLHMEEPFRIRGDNYDQYQVFVLPTGLEQDREIAAIELRPGNRRIVHHALIATDTTGLAAVLDADTPEPGYESFGGFGIVPTSTLPGYVPGATPVVYPQGIGQILHAGSDVVMQVHFAPWPLAESEQSTVNIFFTKEPVARVTEHFFLLPDLPTLLAGALSGERDPWISRFQETDWNQDGLYDEGDISHVLGLLAKGLVPAFSIGGNDGGAHVLGVYEFAKPFLIPPEEVVEFEGVLTVDRDLSLFSVTPHCHLLGRRWEVFMEDPEGRVTNLIRIEDWDFNWQGSYVFEQFVKLPAGSRIHARATYDNTSDNILNPNVPPQASTWGERTTDEMFFLAFEAVPYREGDEQQSLDPARFRTTAVDVLDDPTPAEFALDQNYPNPFNASTHIRYQISAPGPAELSVYDVAGQQVAVLAQAHHPAGTYVVPFTPAALASGAYFYRLSSPSGILTGKMVLLK